MNINHQGIGTGGGLTFALAPALKVAAGQQMNFAFFNRLATRTNVQGQVDVCQPGRKCLGVFVDCSAKGDSGTVETEGFEWIDFSGTTPVVGDVVTPAADGKVALIAAGTGLGEVPTLAECFSGAWQVDAVDTTTKRVLINLGC